MILRRSLPVAASFQTRKFWRAGDLAAHGLVERVAELLVGVPDPGDPEVHDLEALLARRGVLPDAEVLGLQVAVDDVGAVDGGDPLEDLLEEVDGAERRD